MLEILRPELLPYALTAAAMLLLALWLAALDIGSAVNRTLALLLILRGMTFLVGPMRIAYGDHVVGRAAGLVSPYLVIPLAAVVAYFISIYPRRRGIFGTTRWGPWLLVGVTGAACVWYMLDHSAYFGPQWESGSVGAQPGPLILFTALRLPMFALAAVVLARDYARDPHGSAGYSMFLVAAGFAINAVVDGILSLGHLVDDVRSGAAWWPYFWMYSWIPVSALGLAIASMAYFSKALVRERHDSRLNEPRRFLYYVAPAAAVSASMVTFVDASFVVHLYDFVHGFWRLLVPFLITYALLRYSLFSIDIKVKAGVKRAIILTAFGLTFFVVSEAAETLIATGAEERIGSASAAVFGMSAEAQANGFGILAAVLLVLVSQPLQRGAQRAADALMPDTKPIASMSWPERREMYLDQYRLVEHDGSLTAKERRMMDRLAAALGLSEDEAQRLERGGDLQVHDHEVVRPSAARRASRSVLLATMMAVVIGAMGAMLEIVFDVGDFTAGLVVAGAITLLLAPLERLAERLTEGHPPPPPEASLSLYEVAVRDALADGRWSRRERLYLDALAERLGIDRRTRRSLHARTRRELVL